MLPQAPGRVPPPARRSEPLIRVDPNPSARRAHRVSWFRGHPRPYRFSPNLAGSMLGERRDLPASFLVTWHRFLIAHAPRGGDSIWSPMQPDLASLGLGRVTNRYSMTQGLAADYVRSTRTKAFCRDHACVPEHFSPRKCDGTSSPIGSEGSSPSFVDERVTTCQARHAGTRDIPKSPRRQLGLLDPYRLSN
jgi:hypothetical protein